MFNHPASIVYGVITNKPLMLSRKGDVVNTYASQFLINIVCVSEILSKWFAEGSSYGNYQHAL